MATYQILYWRKIPAQLKVAGEGKRLSHPLSDAYQVEIDRIAMEEGLEGTDAYLDQWKWSEKFELAGTNREVADAVEAELRAAFSHLFSNATE
jgi:hypothetical protein